jgi:hypothetical protein
LVVEMVGDDDPHGPVFSHHSVEKSITESAGPVLDGLEGRRDAANLEDFKGNTPLGAKRPDKSLIPVGGLFTEAVIHMGRDQPCGTPEGMLG